MAKKETYLECEELCEECDANLVVTPNGFATCPNGCGKLLFFYTIKDEQDG